MCVEQEKEVSLYKRSLIYVIGIFFVSLGIVLCKKCGMGISPISSIPLVLSYVTPLTFGMLTSLFHFVNTALQMILSKNMWNVKIWFQIPLAFVFGWVIDWLNGMIRLENMGLVMQIAALFGSVFFTALGMVCMLDMNLIQNPPDGTVRHLSLLLRKDLGTVKIGYDLVCVISSVLLSIVFLGRVEGFGIATVISALFVGKTIGWIRQVSAYFRHFPGC